MGNNALVGDDASQTSFEELYRAHFWLIDELLDHKIYCHGQDHSAARFELERFLGIEAWESQSLVQHAVHSARHTHVPGDNTGLPSIDKRKKVA